MVDETLAVTDLSKMFKLAGILSVRLVYLYFLPYCKLVIL